MGGQPSRLTKEPAEEEQADDAAAPNTENGNQNDEGNPSNSSHEEEPFEVFLSHAGYGAQKNGIVSLVHDELQKRNIRTFFDRDPESSLRHGEVADAKMVWAAATAKVVVVVLSPQYISRVWTLKELEKALARCGCGTARQMSARRFRDGDNSADFLKKKLSEEELDLVSQVDSGADGIPGEIYPMFFELFPGDCDDLDKVLDEHDEVAKWFGKWSINPERKLYPDRWRAALAHLRRIVGAQYVELSNEDHKGFAKRAVKMIRNLWFPGRTVQTRQNRYDPLQSELLDEKVREEIPAFLGLPQKFWRGVYPALRRDQCDILQFCVQSEPGDDLSIVGNMNLTDFLDDDPEGREVLNRAIETDESPDIRWLSSFTDSFEGLHELVEVTNERLRSERRTVMVDLLSQRKKLVQIKTAAQFVQSILPVFRRHETAILAALAAMLQTGRPPAHLYVITGVEFVDLRATAELRRSSMGPVVGDGSDANAGRVIPDYLLIEYEPVAIQLMKFKPEGEPSAPEGRRQDSRVAAGNSNHGSENSGEDSVSSRESSEMATNSSSSGALDQGRQHGRTVRCWRVGAPTALDETDQLTCSRPMVRDVPLVPEGDAGLAIELYRKAADEGHLDSINKLGLCYLNGIGVAQDDSQAVALFQQAADKGHTGSIYNLGTCYKNGVGTVRDVTRSVELFRVAADRGNPDAIFRLALSKLYGHGTEQDLIGAFETASCLSNKDHVPGLNLLAHLSACGVGHQSTDRISAAETILRKALHCQPDNITSLFMLASILASSYDSRHLSDARELAERLLASLAEQDLADRSYGVRAKGLLLYIKDLLWLHQESRKVPKVSDFISDAEVQFIAQIGSGLLGKVYIARFRRERWVAVKYPLPDLFNDEAFRFVVQERSTCQAIDAAGIPGVVKYLGFVNDFGHAQHGLMFELCSDISWVEDDATEALSSEIVATGFAGIPNLPDWSDRVRSSLRHSVVFSSYPQFSVSRVVGMLRQVAESLLGVHRLGFLHRDIADRNVLCDAEGNVRLADFGLAKFVLYREDERELLANYTTQLTPGRQYAIAWWAPENMGMFDGREAVFSTKSDVYSFGVLAWQCFSHRDPFDEVHSTTSLDDTARIIIEKILAGERPNLSYLDASTPKDLISLMEACWDKDPETRPELETVIQELARIEAQPRNEGGALIRSTRVTEKKWFDVARVYLSISLEDVPGARGWHREQEKTLSINARSSSNGSKTGRGDRRPYDIFLVHTGQQKKIEVATMENILETGGLRCFMDEDMHPSPEAPTDHMQFALETCRHAVVVLSRAFLARRVPWNELVYCFQREQWVRNHHQNWRTIFVVLYDLSVSEFQEACASSGTPVPDIAPDVVVLVEWSKFKTWWDLCQELKVQIGQDDQEGAVVAWSKFLETHSKSDDDRFPRADWVYR